MKNILILSLITLFAHAGCSASPAVEKASEATQSQKIETDDPHKKGEHVHHGAHKHQHKHKHAHHTDHNKSNQHMNKHSFESLSKRFESEERKSWQKPDVVIEKLGDIKGKKIADIGAGTGYFSFRMAALGAQVSAIDVDERFQKFIVEKVAKENTTNLVTKLVGFEDPELGEAVFDTLLIVNTYHHFNDKIAYMTHCLKGLKPGGILMNVDFKKMKTPHGPSEDHRIAAEDVKKDLLQVGFSDVQIDQTSLPEQYIITAKK